MLAENDVADELSRVVDVARTRDGGRNAFVGADHEEARSAYEQ
jgi:hypothetical protein